MYGAFFKDETFVILCFNSFIYGLCAASQAYIDYIILLLSHSSCVLPALLRVADIDLVTIIRVVLSLLRANT